MIFNLDAVKTLSEVLPFTEEKKQKFIDASSSIIEFRSFISEKYIITAKDAEAKISSDVQKINLGNSISEASNATYQYAIDEGYSKADELKNSIIYLSNALQDFNSNFKQ